MVHKDKKKEEIRQFAEKFLNQMLEGDLVNRVAWVMNAFPLSDLRDVALGYVIGVTMDRFETVRAFNKIFDGRKPVSEDYNALMVVFQEKLPKIIEKIEKGIL